MTDNVSPNTEKGVLFENLDRCLRYLSDRAWVTAGSISERYNSHVGLIYLLFCHHYGISVGLYGDDNISEKIRWILMQDQKDVSVSDNIRHLSFELIDSIGGMSMFEGSKGEPYLRYIENYLYLSDKYYSDVIDYIINFAISSERMIRTEHSSSDEIANLIGAIAENVGARYMFDPCAGYCSIACSINQPKVKFLGQEINSNVALLSTIRLLAHEIDGECIVENSCSRWSGKVNYCDTLVSDLPLGMRIPTSEVQNEFPSIGRRIVMMEELVINRFLDTSSLRKAVITVLPSFCIQDRYLYLRDILCKTNILSDVIILPENTRPGTGTQSCVLVLNKDKSCSDVRFIDATQMVKEKGRTTILDWEKVKDTFLQSAPYSDKAHIRQVNNMQILESGLNLNPYYYTFDDEINSSIWDDKIIGRDGCRLVQLGDILDVIRPNMSTPSYGKVIKISDIRQSGISHQITGDSLLDEKFSSRMQCIEKDCIVITSMSPVSAAMLSVNDNKVFCSPGRLLFFNHHASQVDPLYLIGEIAKPYFQRQISRYSIGRFAKISADIILQCKIKIPSRIEQQRNEWVRSQIDSLKSQSVALQEISEMQHQKFVRNQRQRKHATQQVLNRLLPALDTFIGCVKRNGTISLDTVVSPKSGRTVEQYLYSLKSEAEKASRLVERYTDLEEYPASEIFEVNKVLQDYCDSIIDDRYHVVFIPSEESVGAKLNMSKQHFVQILDNLFTNAKKYGFEDDNRHDYAIRVELFVQEDKSRGTCAIINVANNGVPVSESIPLDKLFAWGIGKGDGIGCYQAKEIAEHFGGDLLYNEYLDDPEGFVCEFRIVLPLYME